ncbi:MAG: CheR family methyltransferase [Bacteroidota bacterium]
MKQSLVGARNKLTDAQFRKLSSYIYGNFGIKLPPIKKVLLEGRLQKRLKATNKENFKDYLEYVFSDEGQNEVIHMIDQVSTNKTDFFREADHFDFMTKHVLPEFVKRDDREQLKVWSSAASSGEEIYTIGIVIEEFNLINKTNIDYSILGTDISVEILKKAINAVYTVDRVMNLPMHYKHKYLLKSKDPANKTVRVIPQIRKKTWYKRLNLIDRTYDVPDNLDIIFCRNVLIYFDKQTQEDVVRKQAEKLRKGGYFFLGHAESILGMDLPLKQVKPTVYRKI